MTTNRYQTYMEDEILTAEPIQLIQLLYRGALDSITAARRHLKLGDIGARSRAISKAMAIITELALSLDHKKGGDVSKNLAELYAYTEQLLIEANARQSDPPLEEAERLLSTLLEGWQSAAGEKQAGDNRTAKPSASHQPVRSA